MSVFSFWSRKGNKSPAPGRPTSILPDTSRREPEVDIHRTVSRPAHPPNLVPPDDQLQSPPTEAAHELEHEPAQEPVVTAVTSPHDASVSEVHGKLLLAEQLSSLGHRQPSRDPLTDAPDPPPELLFDPSTGTQRGVFEPVTATSGDSEQLRDEVWAHLARIRELQSEIAMMHMHMEGIGDGSGSVDIEVDIDVDVDTVPTQEEEDAAKREKEFMRLPGRFKGRSDNINAMMAKLDGLSQAVTAFHALQPPPLSFDSTPTSRQTTHPDTVVSPGEHAIPVSVRTRPSMPPAAMFGTRVGPDQNQIAEMLHDSPVSAHVPLPALPTNT